MRILIAAAFAAAALGCAPPAELTGEASLAAIHPIVGGQYTGTLDSIYFGGARELTLDLECGPEAGGWAEYVSPDISCFSVITFVGATDDARFYEDTTLSGCPEGLLVLRTEPPDGIYARWSVPGDTMTTEEGYLHLTDPSRCEPCEDCAPAPGAMSEPVPETRSADAHTAIAQVPIRDVAQPGRRVPTAASGSGSCDDGNPCTNDYRVSLGPTSAFCVHPKKADGTVCGGDPTKDDYGRCDNGICAWTNWTCVDGGAGASCGDDIDGTCTSDGVCCYGCIDSTGACQDVECWGLLNGAACPDDNVCIDGGTCGYMTIDGIIQGECITGLCCLDPATCQTPACGEYGDVSVSAAASCDDGNPCSLDHRVWLGPSSSYCAHKALPGGTACTVGSCTGTCYPPKLDGTPGHCSCGGGLTGTQEVTGECVVASNQSMLACWASTGKPYAYICSGTAKMPDACTQDSANRWCCAESQPAQRSEVMIDGLPMPRFVTADTQRIYWIENASGDISSAKHNGGDVDSVWFAVAPAPIDMALHDGIIYAATPGADGAIVSVPANGSAPPTVVATQPYPRDVTAYNGTPYWNGGSVINTIETSLEAGGMARALDVGSAGVFWFNENGTMRRAIGAQINDVLTGPVPDWHGFQVSGSLAYWTDSAAMYRASILSGVVTTLSTVGGRHIAVDGDRVAWFGDDGVRLYVGGKTWRLNHEHSGSGLVMLNGVIFWSTWTGKIGRVKILWD